jgi:hypothetical protein
MFLHWILVSSLFGKEDVHLHCIVLVNSNHAFQNPTRAQRARAGVHLNRRLPSKADYVNYVLYQASQKAYEATFLNSFVAHALHPDRIAQCSDDASSGRQNIAEYMKSISHEVNGITKKMIWNAHCRTVHLLAGDGMDGAPFLDVHNFDTIPFSSYGPDNLFPVADRINGSWHRISPHPVMVRYSTKEYQLGYQTGPLEDLDDVAQTLFRKENFARALPAGRAIKPSSTKKRKGQNMPGAAIRDEQPALSRRNWLPFPLLNSISEYQVPQSVTNTPPDKYHEPKTASVHRKSRVLSNNDNSQHEVAASPSSGHPHTKVSRSTFRHDEEPLSRDDSGVPIDDTVSPCIQNDGMEDIEKVHHWRAILINDHKRRLTRKWGNPPQALDCAFRSFKQVVAAAVAMGIRPIAHDYQKKIHAITAREQPREHAASFGRLQNTNCVLSAEATMVESRTLQLLPVIPNVDISESSARSPPKVFHNAEEMLDNSNIDKTQSGPSRKKRKKDEATVQQGKKRPSTQQKPTKPEPRKQLMNKSLDKDPSSRNSQSLHPSGSMTLELHQHLPPNAYFEPAAEGEKYVWRCSSKHAMGHYYNSGNRKNCRGCNTSLSDNIHVVQMDFYMPLMTFYYQPASNVVWKPSRPSARPRKSGRPCHNAVAKDAYWEAMSNGATEGEARQMGVDAVMNYLKPKPPRKAPTPQPTPTPEPDLGPHPSGSATMEHGQEIPDGYYWKKTKDNEEYAWRCDVNHALGRYYLAGDKKSCPGCGSCQSGMGKHEEMDFYLPSGVIVRQEAPGLSIYKPRRPYKTTKADAPKKDAVTHNQMCSKLYFEFIEEGLDAVEAMRLAIERVDSELEKKLESKMQRQDMKVQVQGSAAIQDTSSPTGASRKDSAATSQAGSSRTHQYRRNSRGGCTLSLIPKRRTMAELNEDDLDEAATDTENGNALSVHDPGNSVGLSSAEEDSSGSDSE